ncbi:tRNA pseudouridine synthase A [Myxozyma melibiosi]|uniref:tRNA pseudouridine synthase A n=1 Tax=Myxozyma melibiosi TaxID=54550 RepID=A0ABR1FC35_9ASCO
MESEAASTTAQQQNTENATKPPSEVSAQTSSLAPATAADSAPAADANETVQVDSRSTSNRGGKKGGKRARDGQQSKNPDMRPKRGRTDWGPRTKREGEGEGNKEPRRPKRKAACLIGYCGTGYHGMQLNPPQKTIEGDLFDALVKAGAISKDNSDDPKKVGFMRAARTDKGVHAAGNVISAKLIIEDEDIVEKINSHLPEQIRVWGITRTTNGFDCHKHCGSRIYEYLIPSFSFLPPRPTSLFGKRIKEMEEKYPGGRRKDPEGEAFWARVSAKLAEAGITQEHVLEDYARMLRQTANIPRESGDKRTDRGSDDELDAQPLTEEQMEIFNRIRAIEDRERRAFRISLDRLELVRKAVKVYEGSHNFHNFTLKKEYTDPSARRYMKNLSVSRPHLIEGTEWISIKIHGQSFMLHQIRKMVCMAAQAVRAGTPISRIKESFYKQKLNIPKAPALGLLLERPMYDGINERLQSYGRGELTFDPYNEQIEAFKQKYIYDKIYAVELRENTFYSFFNFIDSFKGGHAMDFFTAKGEEDDTAESEVFLDEEDKEELLSGDEADREG